MRIVENQTVKEDPEVVTVALRQSEVNALVALFGNVGGCHNTTPRGVIAEMNETLHTYADWDFRSGTWCTEGSVSFRVKK